MAPPQRRGGEPAGVARAVSDQSGLSSGQLRCYAYVEMTLGDLFRRGHRAKRTVRCGGTLPSRANFCPHCGHRIASRRRAAPIVDRATGCSTSESSSMIEDGAAPGAPIRAADSASCYDRAHARQPQHAEPDAEKPEDDGRRIEGTCATSTRPACYHGRSPWGRPARHGRRRLRRTRPTGPGGGEQLAGAGRPARDLRHVCIPARQRRARGAVHEAASRSCTRGAGPESGAAESAVADLTLPERRDRVVRKGQHNRPETTSAAARWRGSRSEASGSD